MLNPDRDSIIRGNAVFVFSAERIGVSINDSSGQKAKMKKLRNLIYNHKDF
jgi:hypothetical protein